MSLFCLALAAAFAVPARSDAPAAEAPSAHVPSAYVLSPDDQIEITVLGHADFNEAVTLLPDGTFRYPVVGTLHAAGLTLDGLTRTLTAGLSSQLNQPDVTVTLRQGRARKVSVIGDGIKTAGQYDFKTGMHLLDLLAVAGGPAAEPHMVSTTLATAGGQTVSVDLGRLLTEADTAQNLPLAPGDILFLTARDPEEGQAQVVGDVVKPGAYAVLPGGISVLALLNEAGGALPAARLTQVQIMHAGQVKTCDLRPLLTTDLSSDAGLLRVLPGDVLLVPENKSHILALGALRSPGLLPIPDDQPLLLTTAYAEAGGATEDGDKKNVGILRRSPTGQMSLVSVNIDDLLQGKNAAVDFALQPNDILFIQTRNHPQSAAAILGALSGLGVLSTLSHL